MSNIGYNVKLTNGQKQKLLTSYRKKAPITLRLKHNQLSGNDKVLLTQSQIKKIEKSKRDGTGSDVKISQTQIKEQSGGFLGAILPTLARVGAMALPWLTKAAAPLATGALSGLVSLGVNRALGGGLFSIPQNKVDKLIQYKDHLTQTQKKQIMNALQSGSGINRFRLTQKQQGLGFGTILASIGMPMLMNALMGKGLHVDPSRPSNSKNVYVGGMYANMMPPSIGTWDQMQHPIGLGMAKKKKVVRKTKLKVVKKVTKPKVVKKVTKPKTAKKKTEKKGKGLILGKNSPFNGIPILGAIL